MAMASCSRSGYDTDLQAAIEASEYEFAYQLQLREVLSLSDSELAFNLQVQEAINASSTNNPDYSASSSSSSSSSDSRIGTFVSEERASPSTTNLKYSFPSFPEFDSGIGPSILEDRVPLFNRDNPTLLTVNARRDQPSSSQVMFVHEEKQSLIFHRNGKEPAIEELNVATPEVFKPPLLDVSLAKSPCVICLEIVSAEECFHGLDCCHTLCIPCLVRYVQFSVFEAKQMRLHCADVRCGETASVEECETFLPSAMAEQWKNLVLEHELAPEFRRVYCPFKDCNAILIRDHEGGDDWNEGRNSAECPMCNRLFCMDCMVPWHAEQSCVEYQRLPVDERAYEDSLFKSLAKNNKWRQCSKCKFFIELAAGCNHMTCRCGYNFCYVCGGPWLSSAHTCDASNIAAAD